MTRLALPRSLRLLVVAPLALVSACDVPAGGGVAPTRAVAPTPFTWKANTPRAVRGYDVNECELAGRGLPPNADQASVAAASSALPLEQIEQGVRNCLIGKGYTLTEMPVCTDEDYLTGQVVQSPEVLPPLQSIQCLNPVAKHMVVRAGTLVPAV